jgi:hypothetical protein
MKKIFSLHNIYMDDQKVVEMTTDQKLLMLQLTDLKSYFITLNKYLKQKVKDIEQNEKNMSKHKDENSTI